MCNEKNKQTNTSKCEMKFEKKTNQKPHHKNKQTKNSKHKTKQANVQTACTYRERPTIVSHHPRIANQFCQHFSWTNQIVLFLFLKNWNYEYPSVSNKVLFQIRVHTSYIQYHISYINNSIDVDTFMCVYDHNSQ